MSSKRPIVAAVIPARMAASRFPGKPLVPILGLPMIEHVRRRVELIDAVDQVWVATCDEEIRQLVEKNGGKVIMTADTHERATDRIEEASHQIEADVIINVQGDEPMVSALGLEQVIAPFFSNPEVQSTCLVYPITDHSDLGSLNIVKCVLSRSNRILTCRAQRSLARHSTRSSPITNSPESWPIGANSCIATRIWPRLLWSPRSPSIFCVSWSTITGFRESFLRKKPRALMCLSRWRCSKQLSCLTPSRRLCSKGS